MSKLKWGVAVATSGSEIPAPLEKAKILNLYRVHHFSSKRTPTFVELFRQLKTFIHLNVTQR